MFCVDIRLWNRTGFGYCKLFMSMTNNDVWSFLLNRMTSEDNFVEFNFVRFGVPRSRMNLYNMRDSPKLNFFVQFLGKRYKVPFFLREHCYGNNVSRFAWKLAFQRTIRKISFFSRMEKHLTGVYTFDNFWIIVFLNYESAVWILTIQLPRSSDLTVCDFYLWAFAKDSVYVSPLPAAAI